MRLDVRQRLSGDLNAQHGRVSVARKDLFGQATQIRRVLHHFAIVDGHILPAVFF